MLDALRDDALTTTADGFALRVALPWIRSLPLASLREVILSVDGEPVDGLQVFLGHRYVPVAELSRETGWWFIQDRVVLTEARSLAPGPHDVDLSFGLVVPYLQAGPDGPLQLPFSFTRTLRTDAGTSTPTVARDVA